MQLFGLFGLLITIAIAAWWLSMAGPIVLPPSTDTSPVETLLDPVVTAEIEAHADLIKVVSPEPNDSITSPLTITGQARGTWYFEASFPVILTNWDGLIIAEGYATAQSDWMTEAFVPFTATLSFENPYHAGDPDFMRRGSLILKKDNPSGLPEHDDALEFTVLYTAEGEIVPTENSVSTYGEAIDAARSAAKSLEF